MLKDISVDSNFELESLVKRTEGMSGSDLKEVCRSAAMIPVREVIRQKEAKGPIEVEKAKLEVNFFPFRLLC